VRGRNHEVVLDRVGNTLGVKDNVVKDSERSEHDRTILERASGFPAATTVKDVVGKLERHTYLSNLIDRLKGEIDTFSKVNGTPDKRFGEDYSRAVWADVIVPKRTMRSKKLGDRTEGAAYCPIQKIIFNPGSRQQVVDRLTTVYGWEPTEFTDKGNPTVDDAVLSALSDKIPMAKTLARVFALRKIIGQLSTGPGSWLNKVDRDTGLIHHYINTGGTVSGRCAHNSPNLGQVPALLEETIFDKGGKYTAAVLDEYKAPYPEVLRAIELKKGKVILEGHQGGYGLESRRLFHVPEYGLFPENGVKWAQVGADLKGIEFRALGEVCAPFDDGELINVIVSGEDIHTYNMKMTGITNRGLIKRILYGLLYGAGDWKLGHTAEPTATDDQKRKLGRELRDALMKGLPALAKAIDLVKAEAESGHIIGLDGRRLLCRSPHSALNLKLQSIGAIVAKRWTVEWYHKMRAQGLNHGWLNEFVLMLFVHDENQAAVIEDFAEATGKLFLQAAVEAGEYYKLACPIEADYKIGHNWAETH